MRLGPIKAILILLALVSLIYMLRQDLAGWARQRGNERLLAGDMPGAEAGYRQAGELGMDAAPLAYNLGVSLYRRGEFAGAQRQFAAALAKAGPGLKSAAHYNRGNCAFRLAERLVASDPEAAGSLFQAAIADYVETLALSPGAVDAGENLLLTRSRLAALVGADEARTGKDDADQARNDVTGDRVLSGARQANAHPGASRAATGAAREAGRADASASAGNSRRDLTPAEAERLLNEARGRERLAGLPHAGKQNGELARPERDW